MAEKENVAPPRKKRRLFLSLNKKSPRFHTVDGCDLEVAAKGVVPDNTTKNNRWVANNFSQWKTSRSEGDEQVPDDLLCSNDAALVCHWLCRFVLETRQESGKPYPPKSVYMLLCGLLRIT